MASNWFGLTLNVVIGFVMVPFVVHRLGDTAYGIWALVLQLTGYMGVADVGVRSALVRFVSRFYAERNHGALNRLLSTALMLYGALAVLCLLGGVVLASWVLPLLQIPASLLSESRITLLLAAATLGLGFPLGIFPATLAGLSRWDLRNVMDIVALLLRTLLIVAFLLAGYGLTTLALIHLCTTLIGFGVGAFFARRLLPGLQFSVRLVRKGTLRLLLGHSTYSFLISLGERISYQMDSIVIAAFLPIHYVTFYVVGFKLIQYSRLFVNACTMIVNPLASGLDAEGRSKQVGELLVRGSKYSLLVAFPLTAGLLVLGPALIRLWMGDEYLVLSGTVLVILALGQFASATQSIGAHVLYGLSKHRVNVWCTGLEAVLNLGISVALVQRFGIYGVALGTSIAAAIVRGWFFPAAFLRILNVPAGYYLRFAILPVFPATASLVFGIVAFRALFAIENFGMLVLAGVSGVALYLPAVWWLSLNTQERATLREFFLRRVFRRELAGHRSGASSISSE